MITFYVYPKPWTPPFIDVQTQALESLIKYNYHVVLLGDEPGTAEASAKYQIRVLPNITRNVHGTPLVSSIFDAIRVDGADKDVVCYINADIVIDESFVDTVNTIALLDPNEWLLIGQRIDSSTNKLHGINGIDYFVFPRNTFQFVYPFALGKFCWDQWLVGNAYRRGLMIIDATKTIKALHLDAPWYFQGQAQSNWNIIHESSEAIKNRNFDPYIRNIGNGTTHYTEHRKDREDRNIIYLIER